MEAAVKVEEEIIILKEEVSTSLYYAFPSVYCFFIALAPCSLFLAHRAMP